MNTKKKPPNPCKKDCTLRSWDCHTWCEKYEKYHQGRLEELAERHVQNEINAYTVEHVRKANKINRRRKWGFKDGA